MPPFGEKLKAGDPCLFLLLAEMEDYLNSPLIAVQFTLAIN